MARQPQPYDDIPGTFVFDAQRSREGYGINMFCMSLMKDLNRQAFKANEAEYLKQFPLTREQTEAILRREYNRMLELGGNIYFTAKLGATDGHGFQYLAAEMTGLSQEDYAKMMLAGGRPIDGNRSKTGQDKIGRATRSARRASGGSVRRSTSVKRAPRAANSRPTAGPAKRTSARSASARKSARSRRSGSKRG